jgi:hypothetical protein
VTRIRACRRSCPVRAARAFDLDRPLSPAPPRPLRRALAQGFPRSHGPWKPLLNDN